MNSWGVKSWGEGAHGIRVVLAQSGSWAVLCSPSLTLSLWKHVSIVEVEDGTDLSCCLKTGTR